MFSIAYRMTGSVAEAEDLVQEAFFRLEHLCRGTHDPQSPASTSTDPGPPLSIFIDEATKTTGTPYRHPW